MASSIFLPRIYRRLSVTLLAPPTRSTFRRPAILRLQSRSYSSTEQREHPDPRSPPVPISRLQTFRNKLNDFPWQLFFFALGLVPTFLTQYRNWRRARCLDAIQQLDGRLYISIDIADPVQAIDFLWTIIHTLRSHNYNLIPALPREEECRRLATEYEQPDEGQLALQRTLQDTCEKIHFALSDRRKDDHTSEVALFNFIVQNVLMTQIVFMNVSLRRVMNQVRQLSSRSSQEAQ